MKRATVWIFVELGGAWPAGLAEIVGPCARRVLAQTEAETPGAFAARAAATLASLPKRARPSRAVVLCNARTDAHQLEARRAVGRALLGVLPAQQRRPLIFAAATPCDRLRPALEQLAGELAATSPRCKRAELLLESPLSKVA